MGIITGLLLIAKMALLWVTQDQNTLSIEVHKILFLGYCDQYSDSILQLNDIWNCIDMVC